jgi:iron-sulfur cluster assembly accessory protein
MIAITEKAREKIIDMQKEMVQETYVRFGVKSECCNELQYALSLAAHKSEQDLSVDFEDFTVLIHPSDVRLVKNTEIDFVDNGFTINNPNPLVSI